MKNPSLARVVFQWDRENRYPRTAIRCTIGVAILVIAAAVAGHPAWGILSGLGALYAGFASFGGVQPARVRRMLATTLSAAAITLLGSYVSPSTIATVAAVSIVGFLLAIVSTKNVDSSTVAVLATGVLVVLSGLPQLATEPWGNAGLVLAGGLLQTALQTIVGPAWPYLIERRATADAFRSLGRFMVALLESDDEFLIPDAQPFQNARDRLDESIHYGLGGPVGPLRHALRAAETMRASLVGFARAFRAVEDRAWAEALARSLVRAFADVGKCVEQGEYQIDIRPTLKEPVNPGEAERALLYWAGMLRRAFEDLATPPTAEEAKQKTDSGKRPGLRQQVTDFFAWLIDSRSVRRLAIGHGLRYALALGIATAVYRLEGMEHGYWFPLTIAIVLRPDYATTLTRGLARLVGTVLGVLVATILVALLHLASPGMIAIMLVAAGFSFFWFRISYLAYSFALTLYVVFSLSASGAHEGSVGLARIEATGLGIAVTLLAAWIWPIWQSKNVSGVLREAFQAQLDYIDAIRTLFETGDHEAADRARHRGRTLRIEAERIVHAAWLEPTWSHRGRLTTAREDLAKLDENAAVLLSVHAEALNQADENARETLRRAEQVAGEMRDRLVAV